jgi:hypothetical protein
VRIATRSGNGEPDLGLLRDQRSLKRVGLVGEIRTSQPGCEVKHNVVCDVESRETHQSTSCETRSDGGSGFLSPRALRGWEYRLPTIQSPSLQGG